MLSALGRREEALLATQEAVTLRRRFADNSPDTFLPNLAMSFNNQGIILSELERREEALNAAGEAVRINTQLIERLPQAFAVEWYKSLRNLRKICPEAGVDPSSDPELAGMMQMLEEVERQMPE